MLVWLEAQERAVVLIRQDVQQTVGSLPYVADALMKLGKQRLATELFVLLVDDHALERAGVRNLTATGAADEQVALPRRETITRVEGDARRADRWQPHDR